MVLVIYAMVPGTQYVSRDKIWFQRYYIVIPVKQYGSNDILWFQGYIMVSVIWYASSGIVTVR